MLRPELRHTTTVAPVALSGATVQGSVAEAGYWKHGDRKSTELTRKLLLPIAAMLLCAGDGACVGDQPHGDAVDCASLEVSR